MGIVFESFIALRTLRALMVIYIAVAVPPVTGSENPSDVVANSKPDGRDFAIKPVETVLPHY